MRLTYTRMADWPRLAWLASCTPTSETIQVYHGGGLEVFPDWFCEAVWAGDFESGAFDETDVVFGSGARLRDGSVSFVSSGSPLDRLHSIQVGGAAWVSNSLPCLLAALDAAVDPAYPDWVYDFRSITRGLGRYRQEIETTVGRVRLTYYDNLRWDGRQLTETPKPCPTRDFSSYERYRGFLDSMIELMAMNLASGGRHRPYRMIAAMSSGYNSPAVAVLARPFGLRETFAFSADWKGERDDGRTVADRLGLKLDVLERGAWRLGNLATPFFAADANGGDVDFAAAEPLLRGRVLLTGHMGHVMWAKRPPQEEEGILARHDTSGLSLLEFRLRAGFVHIPVPLLGARQGRDILAISHSEEMVPWDVGGNYNRPVPRRIVEEAGVPRGEFAVEKKSVSLTLSRPNVFWSGGFVGDYWYWLRTRSGRWWRRGRVPPIYVSRLARRLRPTARRIVRRLDRSGIRWLRRSRLRQALGRVSRREYLYKFVFPWAIERAKAWYPMKIADPAADRPGLEERAWVLSSIDGSSPAPPPR